MHQRVEDVTRQSDRAGEQIPTVPAFEPAEVNSECGQPDYDKREQPARPPTEGMRDAPLHQMKREQSEHQSREHEGLDEQDVKPERHRRARLQVDEVRDKIRRIRQE